MSIETTDTQDLAILAIQTKDSDILRKLATHENEYIRLKVACNSASPQDVIDLLAQDPDFFVQESANLRITHAIKRPAYQDAPHEEWEILFFTQGKKVIHVDYDDQQLFIEYEASPGEIKRIIKDSNPKLVALWQQELLACGVIS